MRNETMQAPTDSADILISGLANSNPEKMAAVIGGGTSIPISVETEAIV